jgi:hypothetical protein
MLRKSKITEIEKGKFSRKEVRMLMAYLKETPKEN